MSQTLVLSPLRLEEGDNPDDIKIAVMTRDQETPSWVRILFRKTKTGIVVSVIKQKDTEIVIAEGVIIPQVFQGHVLLVSQESVDAQRKLMEEVEEIVICEACLRDFRESALDNYNPCPSCGIEEKE